MSQTPTLDPRNAGIENDEYDVHVTLKIAIRKRGGGKHPGLRDEIDKVWSAFCRGAKKEFPEAKFPMGTVRALSWEGRVLDAKALRRVQRRWFKEHPEAEQLQPAPIPEKASLKSPSVPSAPPLR
jgi:hypothetical protein